MIYFTADCHFWHENAIMHNDRPFENAVVMNDSLIQNWNDVVSCEDEVYILGDFTFKGITLASEVFNKLNGTKHLIIGNHDRKPVYKLFETHQDYLELEYNNIYFILSHYPFLEWNGYFKGSIHLHGHCHNKKKYNIDNKLNGIRRYDVGADANNYKPVSIEEIIKFYD
ncbi:MAG: hydrolase [bacterium]